MQHVHILIPVWGQRYIDIFATRSLPGLLAKGNIPYLAQSCQITIVFLTKSSDIDVLRHHPLSERILPYCSIVYESIDDLIANCRDYAVPLTLALARGIFRTGSAMTETYFIMYNADFVLADDSCKAVLHHMQQGVNLLYATSFRVEAEHFFHTEGAVHDEKVVESFVMSKRDMVRRALQCMHITVTSRIINQSLLNCHYWNQVYWRVDDTALLARYFLATHFCVRPTVYREDISSFIDYALVPDFCPDGKISCITDSDDFFMVEMQGALQEFNFLKPDKPEIAYIAHSLGTWTTAAHRDCAQFEVFIHSDAAPACLEEQRVAFGHAMDSVFKMLPSRPWEHDTHVHWVSALENWMPYKVRYDAAQKKGTTRHSGVQLPWAPITPSYYRKLLNKTKWFMACCMGTGRYTMPWHPLWAHYGTLRREFCDFFHDSTPVLYITNTFQYDALLPKDARFIKIFACDMANGHVQLPAEYRECTRCIVAIGYESYTIIDDILQSMESSMDHDMDVLLCWGRDLNVLRNTYHTFMQAYYYIIMLATARQAPWECLGNIHSANLLTKVVKTPRRILVRPFATKVFFVVLLLRTFIHNVYRFFVPDTSRAGLTGILVRFKIKGKKDFQG